MSFFTIQISYFPTCFKPFWLGQKESIRDLNSSLDIFVVKEAQWMIIKEKKTSNLGDW